MNLPNDIIFKPVPNFTKGRLQNPDMIVIHIAEGNREGVYQTFLTTPKSTHFLINKDGSIWQFVSTGNTAYGNGIIVNPISEIVLNRTYKNPNDYTISIEFEGYSVADITEIQYNSGIALVSFLCKKWSIPANSTHIIRHREIESSKGCPGLVNVERIIQGVRLIK